MRMLQVVHRNGWLGVGFAQKGFATLRYLCSLLSFCAALLLTVSVIFCRTNDLEVFARVRSVFTAVVGFIGRESCFNSEMSGVNDLEPENQMRTSILDRSCSFPIIAHDFPECVIVESNEMSRQIMSDVWHEKRNVLGKFNPILRRNGQTVWIARETVLCERTKDDSGRAPLVACSKAKPVSIVSFTPQKGHYDPRSLGVYYGAGVKRSGVGTASSENVLPDENTEHDPATNNADDGSFDVDTGKPKLRFSVAALLHLIGVGLLFCGIGDVIGGWRRSNVGRGVGLLLLGGLFIAGSRLMVFAWALELGRSWFGL